MTDTSVTDSRHFLLLQGPHGPFFRQLAEMLQAAGARTTRVLFNGGDRVFARHVGATLPFTGAEADWPAFLRDTVAARGITDVVLYGAPRPIHREALEAARAMGLGTHIFEEGYLRPYWITYEREGTNGHSRLMSMSAEEITTALGDDPTEIPEAPATWGEMRQHVFYGALYHAAVLAGARDFRNYTSHRGVSVAYEFRLYLRRLLLMPAHHVQRAISVRRLRRGGFPYHLVLLQLTHDASFQTYSDFDSVHGFIEVVIRGFARGAPGHHHLVFKAHPLEDGRTGTARIVADLARANGISERVHFQVGGKLATLLDSAETAVTVNSTAAQQALWRGLPVKAFGKAVYHKPEFVSDQPMAAFFAAPHPPDLAAYRRFRQFLLKTSQLRGGFYSASGRKTLMRKIVDVMLDPAGPYEKTAQTGAARPQHVRLIR